MDGFSVCHGDRTKCSGYAIKSRTHETFFLFIKSAANVLFVSDKFYKVVLVFYSLPLSVYMSSL